MPEGDHHDFFPSFVANALGVGDNAAYNVTISDESPKALQPLSEPENDNVS